MSTIRRTLRTFVVAEAGQTLQGHAVGLLVGVALGLLLWLFWKALPFVLFCLFIFVSQIDGGTGPASWD